MKKCKGCKKETLIRENNKFCSQECYFKWQVGKNNPAWNSKILECENCSKEIKVNEWRINRFEHHFCSKDCYDEWQKGREIPNHHMKKEKYKEQFSERTKKQWKINPPIKNPSEFFSRIRKGKSIPQRTREKISKTMSKVRKKQWQNPKYREKMLKSQNNSDEVKLKRIKSLRRRPTSLERRFKEFIKENNLPYRYTGDGSFLIGYKNPDFVNVNGEKICIEVANRFHHKDPWAKNRIEHFKKWGWECIVIFEDEFDNLPKLFGG